LLFCPLAHQTGVNRGPSGGNRPAIAQLHVADERVVLRDEPLESRQWAGLADFISDPYFFSLHPVAHFSRMSFACLQ
jgi:hypothetical protein